MNDRPILLAAGGTGGHLFPAEALAHALGARGAAVELVTDERALAYGGSFPARAMHCIPSATPRGGSLFEKARAVAQLAYGTAQVAKVMSRLRPRAVIGFGGYPTVPPLLAASFLKIPTVLHESNAIMGKANRFLSGHVDKIAAGLPNLAVPPVLQSKVVVTGNPVRPAVLEAATLAYPDFADGTFRLLVTGGSQGARVMADIVPEAIAALPDDLRSRIRLVQQTRAEDIPRVQAIYESAKVDVEIAPFFKDLPMRIAQAHFVIARAGASTVSELAVIGRPSLLVPLPHSLDGDQAANAAVIEQAGAAETVKQSDFSPAFLTARLAQLIDAPQALAQKAEAAKRVGVADAAERLADLILNVAQSRAPQGDTLE
ncbi:undecaprenyldiphospho-muramoylpentapeptide beta-N-acetylglucosaminyltransferase [Methylocystis sp. MJC1]|jgi:UDP-N-acetylglucosamine--N-acetylmuramyl-(pentapeptide) pyrophosphoryl-undecaprenol N-acetylglucosamine transferase|uniref:undecaprenyldiphospho-muramoylpentapeptide beta-N-acetylglucosaminyltransferase n=1 Tax=Methylocystis sp. MJC1 TaxID=2654282 RepID=UPI0013EAC619|nr:undecaprenyldiphospho-muramoylpentapeptide beta-N-acetylglucosaminyltransferase [Methylocystis sp. MJC1]MBU6527928.1 undecaprenyldiphospho-muramoylpentapeptide beta-N-acetylglucosaminyltransferase [Methylocystis sp. MJC1]UZX10848.1 undecaprenyldiphospho-muramoylpentapeptide beta-N-acetylglucosaminyltransferase [Methylocystis sp. MJC1]